MKRTLLSRLFGLLAIACILPAISGTARAQGIFQSIYGGGNELGNSVQYTPVDGGSISAGTSASFGVDNDVYVVKTNACGTLLWSNTYDLGGYDDGRKIELTSDGGYIVTGTTENANNCCNRYDVFLLKLDAGGNVQWAMTYGGTQYDMGTDVVQNPTDNGYVICGGTFNFGWNTPIPGEFLGWILRTDVNGQLLWSRSYGPQQKAFFSSVALANGGSEIVAAGVSQFGAGNADIFAVRVQDVDGSFGATGWAYHMQPLANSQATRIRECANGNLIIAGYSQSPSGNGAAYLLEVQPNGTYVNDRTYEFNGAFTLLNDVRELPSGDFVVVGYEYNPFGGFGGGDVLLMEVDRTTLNSNWISIHGGANFEYGAALDLAPTTLASAPYDVYAVGYTGSFAPGTNSYLIRANAGGFSGCNDAGANLFFDSWGQTPLAITFPIPYARVQCKAGATQVANAAQTWLCHVCTVTRKSSDGDPGDIGDGGNHPAGVRTGASADGILSVQPNPVASGGSFVINYRGPFRSPMTITIADVAGHVVYNSTEDFPLINGEKIIETKGWSSGSYMVRVEINGTSETKRVVVLDK
ncbi:MAG: T9SS type A sorting domain-containing protein [Candidatus Kapaibacterium sp.]